MSLAALRPPAVRPLLVPAVRRGRPNRCRPAPPRGFTLVELLVVIGIIALLISILLPALGKAREQGNAIKCLSNMRQIATALVVYCGQNRDCLPTPAEGGDGSPPAQNGISDWVYWVPKTGAAPWNDVNQSILTPYLGSNGRFPVAIMTCASDTLADHQTVYGGRPPYPFSYSMNAWCAGANSRNTAANIVPALKKVSQIRAQVRKIWLIDESENTINDGMFAPEAGSADAVAERHDGRKKRDGTDATRTANGRGNVAYVDGHAEYTSREDVHKIENYHPYR